MEMVQDSAEVKASEKTDCDDNKRKDAEIDELVSKIMENFNRIYIEDKEIINRIQKVLDEHNLKYLYHENEPKSIKLWLDMENKPLEMDITLKKRKIILKLSFPFRVQANAYPLMCMFIAEFNENKAFGLLKLDPDNGELMMEYSYMFENPDYFNEEYFWMYLKSLIYPALDVYIQVAHLSMGRMLVKEKEYYKKILEMALMTIDGDFDDDDVDYGTSSLRMESYLDFLPRFRDEDETEDYDDSEVEDEDCTQSSNIGREKLRHLLKFIELKELTKDGNSIILTDQTSEPSGVLSMFAKKDDDEDSGTAGGRGDE